MDIMKFLLTGAVLILLSSCAQDKYVDVQTSEIKHSSPDVVSLYEAENEKLRRENTSGGFVSWLLDGLLGSDPDDDDSFYNSHHGHDRKNDSPKRQRRFISKNGETLRSKLESKKE
jgi:hypothetical protein